MIMEGLDRCFSTLVANSFTMEVSVPQSLPGARENEFPSRVFQILLYSLLRCKISCGPIIFFESILMQLSERKVKEICASLEMKDVDTNDLSAELSLLWERFTNQS
jgi:hypothetical protein